MNVCVSARYLDESEHAQELLTTLAYLQFVLNHPFLRSMESIMEH